jgi:carboxyl-terminal processing protease
MRAQALWLRAMLVGSFLTISTLAFCQAMTQEQKNSVSAAMSRTIMERAFVPGVDFSKWPEFIAKQQTAIDAAEDMPAYTTAMNRALREFGFSHIRLLTPRAETNRRTTQRNGIGTTATPNEEGLLVRGLAEEGPAKAAGIEVGDIILTVNGTKAEKTEQLEGELGEKRAIEVKKKASGETVKVEVEIKTYSTVRKETLTWLDEETAVLRIFTFSNGYSQENVEKLMGEAGGKAKYLILDLRSNGGGAVNNMGHLLSLFLPAGTEYGCFVNRKIVADWQALNPSATIDVNTIAMSSATKSKTRTVKQFKPFEGKVAVLINRGSASASEITACALREKGGAKLVGSKSAGAVLASVFGRLPEGFSLQYPVSDYVSADGMRLEAHPLMPDVEVTATDATKDLVVERAVEALKGPVKTILDRIISIL